MSLHSKNQTPGSAQTADLSSSTSPAASRIATRQDWPIQQSRRRPRWFPSHQRLIGLVRASSDSFVLPPAIVRKAAWKE